MDPKAINALLVKVGVNMGDHGQDVTTALVVKRNETVTDLVERALHSQEYRSSGFVPVAQSEWRIELRLAADPVEGQVF